MTGTATIGPPPRPAECDHLPEAGVVHLWLTSVEPRPDDVAHWDVLDEPELARAARLLVERDRVRFVNRRAFVRRILGRYLGIEPSNVRIRSSRGGRPELEAVDGVFFNASHSDGGVALAVTSQQHVGVDIERLRRIDDALELARGLFTAGEVDWLRGVAEPDRSRAFLTLWTRKESVVKAAGEGLSMPLDAFDVLDADGRVRWHNDVAGPHAFSFADLGLPEGYVGAVTLVGSPKRPSVVTMADA